MTLANCPLAPEKPVEAPVDAEPPETPAHPTPDAVPALHAGRECVVEPHDGRVEVVSVVGEGPSHAALR